MRTMEQTRARELSKMTREDRLFCKSINPKPQGGYLVIHERQPQEARGTREVRVGSVAEIVSVLDRAISIEKERLRREELAARTARAAKGRV